MKKHTLITGASSGIGLELARIAAGSGNNLVLLARDQQKLHEVKKELESTVAVHILPIDLSTSVAASEVFAFCQNNKLEVDCLINDAGFGDYGQFKDVELEKQEAMIDLNIRTLTGLTRLFLPDMVKAGNGKIMNLGSIASFLPGPNMSVYYASKHYVLSFSESLAEELRGTGVTVTCLCPGPTKSGFSKAANASRSAIFSGKLPTAKAVAEFGWHSMQEGKTIAIHGTRNRIALAFSRLVPRHVLRKLVRSYQR